MAGDHGVAPGPVLLHVEVVGAVAHERVELLEGAGVQQLLDPLPGGVLAAGVLLLLGLGGGVQRRLPQLLQLGELLLVGFGGPLAGGFAMPAAGGRQQRGVGLAVVWARGHGAADVIRANAKSRAGERLQANSSPAATRLGVPLGRRGHSTGLRAPSGSSVSWNLPTPPGRSRLYTAAGGLVKPGPRLPRHAPSYQAGGCYAREKGLWWAAPNRSSTPVRISLT